MGRYLDMFKKGVEKADNKLKDFSNDGRQYDHEREDFDDDFREDFENDFDDVGIQPSQKSESFHHFILENQYRELEKSIRGFKDIFDKNTQQWKTVRKGEHCFTDEEAEEIVGTTQSHLATDIKLSYIAQDSFPLLMDTIYQEIAFLFESIAEYRYGRYGDYESQYKMKLQNHKIFLELFTRIQANYSRAIQGQENKLTHDSVKGQESLQQTDRDLERNRGYF